MESVSYMAQPLRWNLTYSSKEARRAYKRVWYMKNRDRIRVMRAERHKINKKHENAMARARTRRIKLEVFSYYSNGTPKCASCGITDMDVLCLDHIDGGGTRERRLTGYKGCNLHYKLQRLGYPSGFQVLCANCNLKKWVRGGM